MVAELANDIMVMAGLIEGTNAALPFTDNSVVKVIVQKAADNGAFNTGLFNSHAMAMMDAVAAAIATWKTLTGKTSIV